MRSWALQGEYIPSRPCTGIMSRCKIPKCWLTSKQPTVVLKIEQYASLHTVINHKPLFAIQQSSQLEPVCGKKRGKWKVCCGSTFWYIQLDNREIAITHSSPTERPYDDNDRSCEQKTKRLHKLFFSKFCCLSVFQTSADHLCWHVIV